MFDKYDIDLVLTGQATIYTPVPHSCVANEKKSKAAELLYLEANTASGCNYDGQPDKTPWYAEKCIQLRTPTYVLLNFSEGRISIKRLCEATRTKYSTL